MSAASARQASPALLTFAALTVATAVALGQETDRLSVSPPLQQSFQSQVIGGTQDWRRAPGEPIQWRLQETTPSGQSRIQFESVDPDRHATQRFTTSSQRPNRDPRPVSMFGIQF